MSIREPDFRPMLALSEVPSDDWLRAYFDSGNHLLAFPKYDGIRLLTDSVPITRKLKILPNIHVREQLDGLPMGLDGELVLPKGEFHDVQSAFMSRHGFPEFEYHVFDSFMMPWLPFHERSEYAKSVLKGVGDSRVQFVPPVLVLDFATLQLIEELWVEEGYEGVILRNPFAPYKYGRSTLNEAGMLKLKRFLDDEAVIVGFEELRHNDNEPKINALGLQERGHGISKKRGGDTLGAFICKSAKFQYEFRVSCGHLTAANRKDVWDMRQSYLNEVITYIYQPHGTKDRPRSARFKWFRRD